MSQPIRAWVSPRADILISQQQAFKVAKRVDFAVANVAPLQADFVDGDIGCGCAVGLGRQGNAGAGQSR